MFTRAAPEAASVLCVFGLEQAVIAVVAHIHHAYALGILIHEHKEVVAQQLHLREDVYKRQDAARPAESPDDAARAGR